MVFYHRRDKSCIRLAVIPHNPDTKAQRVIRRTFADAVKSWQSITDEEKYKYNRKAGKSGISGYNLYISEYMRARVAKPSGLNGKWTSNAQYSSSIQRLDASVSAPFTAEIRQNLHALHAKCHSG